ncbi:GNAT family N-acetyltransferase [Pseudonocardia sp.]|uniref:GNAT family N-acetyltransferase n=1 Tax=Pseudonocardia sp. TaxID=60912 RepID=UPI0026098AB0|nr:GNAT family N-acetyltransferase [Pseudonocardia sp.]
MTAAESHLMRRSPRQGRGPGGMVVYTLEDVAGPAGEDPKAVIEVRRVGDVATVVGGGVPQRHRGQGFGRRLARQVTAAVRAEGCRIARIADPGTDQGRRMLVDLGYARLDADTWELVL